MQFAAHLGRLTRLTAGCAGVGVIVAGAVSMPTSVPGVPPVGRLSDPAAALVPAGIALLLQVLPVAWRTAGRVVRVLAVLFALAAAAIGAAGLDRHPSAAVAALFGGLAVGALDRRVSHRITDPLIAGALVSAMLAHVPTPDVAGGLLVLAIGATLARLPVPPAPPDRSPPAPAAADMNLANAVPMAPGIDIARVSESLNELRESNNRLAAALAFKNDLTSMLTHDVAQPISSIASLAELLRADWADLPDDIRLELTTKIDKNAQRLIKMMNDLQLLFRLDTGSVTARRAPVPLSEVADQVTAVASGDVELEIADEPVALADRGHLIAVVQNLLDNAFAYGDPPVRLIVRRTGDEVELVVQDSGPGIPEHLLEKLFDRFMRGAGLGLFIVRHLVEANGGAVRYERAEPRGARLIVTLEAAPLYRS